MLDLEAIKKREQAATEGPWWVLEDDKFIAHAREDIPALIAEVERLRGIIAQHDLCHDLHGKVNAEDFAKGCEAEQRRIYGCAPHADEVERLQGIINTALRIM